MADYVWLIAFKPREIVSDMKEREAMSYGSHQSAIIDNFETAEVEEALVDYAIRKNEFQFSTRRYGLIGWAAVADLKVGDVQYVDGLGDVTVLANTYRYTDYDSTDNGGESFHLVIGVEDKFFKMEGHMDSYGERSFNGTPKQVTGKTKTITVFDVD